MPDAVQIAPQEMVISNRDVQLNTLLGSCVAICLFDGQGTGAMCHALLPAIDSVRNPSAPVKERLKYVDSALEFMLERFARLGIPVRRLDARLYGGANMFEVKRDGIMDIGCKNIEAAQRHLNRHGIPISAMDVGGFQGRKISFNPSSGEVSLYLVPAEKLPGAEVRS